MKLNHLLNQLLRYQLLSPSPATQRRGFTLIELLVVIIIIGILAVLVVSGLLTFVNSISQAERRELVKANAQQDMQDAVDFMVRDLQEAVYIYDAVGLSSTGTAGIADNIPPVGGAGNLGGAIRCDSAATCRPVLAFWKRRALDRCDSLAGAGGATRVGIVTGQGFATGSRPATAALNSGVECARGNDTFVYSFVAYYIIRDPDANPSPTWSRSARIGRFEIRDGVSNPTVDTTVNPGNRFNSPAIPPDAGYLPFNLGNITADTRIQSIDEAMRAWKSDATLPASFSAYTPTTAYPANSLQILTDFVDDTPTTSTNPAVQNSINVLSRLLPIPITGTTPTPDAACADPNRGAMGAGATRVPSDLTAAGQLNLSSFYACVSANRAAARVYLRGNALARLSPRVLRERRPVTATNVGFLPTAEARVYGRGFFVPVR